MTETHDHQPPEPPPVVTPAPLVPPPPMDPWTRVPPPPPAVDPDRRPNIVTGVAITLLVLAAIELMGFLPSEHEDMIHISNTVRQMGWADSILAIAAFVVAGIGLLQMRPTARVWAIRLILLRFVAVAGVSILWIHDLSGSANQMPIKIAMIGMIAAAVIFSIIITVVLIILLTRPAVVEAFRRRGE
jgi:hypothetical protein